MALEGPAGCRAELEAAIQRLEAEERRSAASRLRDLARFWAEEAGEAEVSTMRQDLEMERAWLLVRAPSEPSWGPGERAAALAAVEVLMEKLLARRTSLQP